MPFAPAAEYLQLLIESATDYAIFSLNLDRVVVMWSAGAERIFKYGAGEIIGQSADQLFTPEDRAGGAPEQEAATALATGRSLDERWHLRRGGERFFAAGVMSVLRDPAARPIGFVKINRDLTERQGAAERLRAAHRDLERRVEERTRELQQAHDALTAEADRRAKLEAARNVLLQRIAQAEENERRRIARELHDGIGQHLAALMLRLDAFEPFVQAADAAARLTEAQQLVETIGREIHAIAVQLRPTALDDLGIAGAIAAYVELWSKRAQTPVRVQLVDVEEPRLPPDLELALYRIAQEALTNVRKHAGATSVSLVVHRAAGEVVLVIEDNGRGFDPEDGGHPPQGQGLDGMRERLLPLGGTLTVESERGRGTTVFARIPLTRP